MSNNNSIPNNTDSINLNNDVKLIISTGASRKSTKWKKTEILWSDFVKKASQTTRTKETFEQYIAMTREQQGEIKDVSPYVGGELKDGIRKNGHVLNRQLITLDADFIEGDFWDGVTLFFDYACLVHSTHKHSSSAPRLRLIIPLSRPVGPEMYEAIARKLAEQFTMKFFDPTTFQPHRLMYSPSTSADGEYFFEYQDGAILEPDSILSLYDDWRDVTTWPRHDAVEKEITRKADKQGNPLEKPGLIGAFCRAFNIHEAIETFLPNVYEPAGQGRYSFVHGSTSKGLVTYEGVYAYSHHGTDPISGQLVNSYDLVRLHLFGEKDLTAKPNTPVNRLPSFKAMQEFAKRDPKVEALIVEEALGDAKLDFDEIDEQQDESSSPNSNRRGVSSELFFNEVTGFDVSKLAEVILDAVRVICVNNRLFVYRKGVYVANDDVKLIDKLVNTLLGSRTRIGYRRELIEFLKIETTVSEKALEPNTSIINLKNGLLNWKTGELKPHDPKFISFAQIPVTYDPLATCENVNRFMGEVVPADTVDLLYEWFGYNLVPDTRFSKAVYFIGSGANGKSAMVDLFTRFIGEKNISNISLQDLSSNRFKLAGLQSKLANVYSDLPHSALEKSDIFKSVVSGDRLSCERKGENSFEFTPYARLTFSMNEIPRTTDNSDGMMRRLIIIEFPNKFSGENADVNLLGKLTTDSELSGLLNKSIEGLRKLYERGRFQENESTAKALNEYKLFNDPVEAFLNECCIIEDDLAVSTKELYEAYVAYLYESGLRAERDGGRNQFYKKIEGKGFTRKRLSSSSPTAFVGLDLIEELKVI